MIGDFGTHGFHRRFFLQRGLSVMLVVMVVVEDFGWLEGGGVIGDFVREVDDGNG